MTFDAHTNFAYSTVATAPSPAGSGTSLTVAAGAGILFPSPPPFNAVVWPAGASPQKANAEIVRVTGLPSTDTLTIVREQEGTSARTIEVGDQIRAWITNRTLTELEEAADGNEVALTEERERAKAAEKALEEAAAAKATTAEGKAKEAAAGEVKTERERAEAAEAAKVAKSEKGAAGGVATLEAEGGGKGRLPEGELPLAVVLSSPKLLGEVEGVTKLAGSEGTLFAATLKGAAEFEVTPPHEPWLAELLLTPGKYTWKIKGASWVGSEPEFGEGRVLITILCWKGEVLLVGGAEGRRGEAGAAGSTVRNGKGAPESGLGANGDFYINTEANTIYGPKTSGGWGSAFSLRGEKGERGEPGTSAAGESSESSFGFVVPVWAGGRWIPTAIAGIGVANRAVYNLIRLPKKGTLHEVVVWNGGTVNGEHNVAVIDTGQSKAGEYTVLWESKGVKAEGENKWQSLGEPGLGVEEVGRHLFLAIMNSGTTHTFGVQPEAISNAAPLLPAGFAIPRLMGAHTFGSLSYGGTGAHLEESKLEAFQKAIMIVARIA
jgi:hypothetical protein